VQTDGTISKNKLDIIIHDNEKGTRTPMGVAISEDRNVIEKEVKKIIKYKDLKIEIQCMWSVEANVVQIIIQGGSNMTGTNGDLFTHRSSRSYLNHLVQATGNNS
jgi:hypothetical protein